MIINNITPEILIKLYHDDNKSLSDIASRFGCTRQYIYKIMKASNIARRNKFDARKLAFKYCISERFFSKWSSAMSYVLGLLFTDGCLQKGKNGKISSVVLSLNDVCLLEKVRDLMQSNHKIHKLKQKGLYSFRFARENIINDLYTLGLFPNKSKSIKFPNIPNEYIRHFIRGCWDGDGSVFFQYKKKLLMTFYVSGSKDFIISLEDILNKKANLSKRTIYHRPSFTSYYFKYAHKDSIKLFHYMYDNVSNSMYLDRKYSKFREGIYGLQSS